MTDIQIRSLEELKVLLSLEVEKSQGQSAGSSLLSAGGLMA